MDSSDTGAPTLISIIMVVRNRADYIAETIQSIRDQTYSHWELLVMDDGSDDGTAEVVRSLRAQDERIHFMPHPRTGITGKLKNEGIALAKGELVCFMDSDDLWLPEKLSRQAGALAEHSEAGFSFTNGYNFRDRDGRIEAWFYDRKSGAACGNFLEAACTGEMGIRFPTLMVRKPLLRGPHLFREARVFSDFSFATNLARQYPAVVLYDVLFARRVHESNTTSEGWIADYEEHVETIEAYRQAGALSAAMSRDILYKLFISLGATYIEKGRPARGRIAFLRAWARKPLSIVPLKKIIRSFLVKE
jgi:glycosyltransferase involved in cell wall biosynthesis